jgi:hypothetical protein
MQEALARYSQSFYKILSDKAWRTLFFSEVNKRTYINAYCGRVKIEDKERGLRLAMDWLKNSQQATADGGFSTYYLKDGWTSSYPETSGYIVPTILRYRRIQQQAEYEEMALNCLNWLLEIQFKEGGWQSGYIHQLRDAVVFNTGQVMRGMLAGFEAFQKESYLNAACKAGDWLIKTQHEDGYWSKHNFLGVARVYDSYVSSPLLQLAKHTDHESYRNAAIKNLQWIVRQKQLKNGWFQDCDNTKHRNHQPITHTIGYTIQGLIEAYEITQDNTYLASAVIPAERLALPFHKNNALSGRYDAQWKGYESFITTGGAQLAIIWQALFFHTGEDLFDQAAKKMTTLLVALQERSVPEGPETKGALFGSFPFWGKYEAFACPNWATKYLADALMNELFGYEATPGR